MILNVYIVGDSVIGSTGANAPNLFKSREQYRGVSFAIGAAETWRTVTTIPNLLRVFNPELVGGSLNTGGELEKGSNLNLARFVERQIYYKWNYIASVPELPVYP